MNKMKIGFVCGAVTTSSQMVERHTIAKVVLTYMLSTKCNRIATKRTIIVWLFFGMKRRKKKSKIQSAFSILYAFISRTLIGIAFCRWSIVFSMCSSNRLWFTVGPPHDLTTHAHTGTSATGCAGE